MDKYLAEIHQKIGVTDVHLQRNKLASHKQPPMDKLEVVEIDFEGRPFILVDSAAQAWRAMCKRARKDEIYLQPFSGFRSYLYQMRLIEKHLQQGRALEDIFKHIAIPGFSEHHTGRAVDFHETGQTTLDESFEKTPDFAWLVENAASFDFYLSYPKGNDSGIIYEPWHWCHRPIS